MKKIAQFFLIFAFLNASNVFAVDLRWDKTQRDQKKQQEVDELQKEFTWWPSDAQPGPVKDAEKGGYWWWPNQPGQQLPWGNRGYIYLYKIIYDYKSEELPPPQPKEMRPSLLIKKIIKNVKVYFDFDSSVIRDDAANILESAVRTLGRNPDSSILITGNADQRGSESYNEKLGRRRAESVEKFMLDRSIPQDRIKIVSRGKLDAVAPLSDLVGMQKDRNAQFVIADVEEVMLPYEGPPTDVVAEPVSEGKYVTEEEQKVESEVKVSTIDYVVQKNDSLWTIAAHHLGSGHRWKYLYELNKDRIKNPNKLKPGITIIIPVE
ncbi:MAG: hypothetical protein A2Z88_03145 [Omnitrophica WOR_2 bacterium GWA2_47_8]|nr:MAG: hypothetical protein A2Z88_03145 [Omnitrophica WOR_2 bacterium GWA2_47_8]